MDCSTRVHATHAAAKSTSNSLPSKVGQPQFVVVEDIRIEAMQLANFEFFYRRVQGVYG
jgi:hypothetical protein